MSGLKSFGMKVSFCVQAACFVSAATFSAHAGASNERLADSPSVTATGELAEIVVTAQKRQERLTDVGVTVAAVTSQQLQNAGVTDISQLPNVVSGFHVSKS